MASPKLSRGSKGAIFNVLPAGTVLTFAGSTAPDGWMVCDGSAISRFDYADLFEAIGETYGIGDGSTTFNLPNAQGLVPRGAGSQVINGRTKDGGSLGSKLEDQMQGHRHGINGGSGVATAGTATNHYIGAPTPQGVNNSVVQNPVSDGTNDTPRGGLETRPSSIAFNFIIKV